LKYTNDILEVTNPCVMLRNFSGTPCMLEVG